MVNSHRIPPNVIAKLSEQVLGTLAALAGEHTTIGPSKTVAVRADEIRRRRTLVANTQGAMHTAFVQMGLYGKHRDVHNHPTDYSMQGKMINGEIVYPVSATALRDQIKRMDATGTKAAVLMAIPLKQSNVTPVRPLDYKIRVDKQRRPSVKPDERTKESGSPRSPTFGRFLRPSSQRRASDAGSAVSQVDSLEIQVLEPGHGNDSTAGAPRRPSVDDSADSQPSVSAKSFAPSDICCGNVDANDATYYLKPDNLLKGEDPRQPTELYYYSAIDVAIGAAYQKLQPWEKERFYPMITAFNVADDQAWQHIHLCLTMFPQTFVGGGEFTVHKEIVDQKVAGTPATTNLKGLDDALRFAGQVGISMTVHCDIEPLPDNALLKAKLDYTAEDHDKVIAGEAARDASGPQAYYKSLLQTFRANPATPIVWAHGAGLGRFVGPRDNHLELLTGILNDESLNHVMIDLSWDQVAAHINANPESLQAWADVLNAHPDRFMFGSDSLVPLDAAAYGKTYRDYQALRALLNPGVEEMVFNKNLKALVERSKTNRDSWERAGFPTLVPGLNGLNRPAPEGPIAKRVWQSLRQKVGDSKDAAATRLANRGKTPSTDGRGNTTKVNVRELKEYQRMNLEDIFEELKDAFVAKYGADKLQQYKDAVERPIVFPAATDSSSEPDSNDSRPGADSDDSQPRADSDDSRPGVHRVPTLSLAPPSAAASAAASVEDLPLPVAPPPALNVTLPVAPPPALDVTLSLAPPSPLNLRLTMPGSSPAEAPRSTEPGSSRTGISRLTIPGWPRNSARLSALDRSIRETQARIDALREQWTALDLPSDTASGLRSGLDLDFSK